MATFDKALHIASQSHLGKRDKGGKPYILHPMRIAMRLRTEDEELMSIAILHDVIEDDPRVTFAKLREEGFSDRVIIALTLLTHQRGESYETYISKMRGNLDALRVKREDLRDNSDITRLKGVTEKDLRRMEKYQRAYLQITEWIKDIEKGGAPVPALSVESKGKPLFYYRVKDATIQCYRFDDMCLDLNDNSPPWKPLYS